ncbi:MAG: LysR family transcriptional regulator [Pseudanabaenaceae cyanobacterium bins.68]|nr:LysR family transcriptional regulator [Pseudanabaenaceae cyanobacterium bins.68]
MRIEELQAFLAVAQTGNFQAAAKLCGVTQSTISRQVQSLEQHLGVALIHRHGSHKLTLAGVSVHTHAQKICQEWQTATTKLRDLIAGKQPELCVAAIPSVCAYKLPPVLTKFGRDYPEVQLRITALGSDRALKVLKDGLIDVAIVMKNRYLNANSEVHVDLLYTEEILLLLAADHPLTQFNPVPWPELARFPQAVFKDGYGVQQEVQDQFRDHGLELKSSLELNSLDAFRNVVKQGELVALLPKAALAEAWHDPALAIRSMASSTPFQRQVVLVTTSDRLEIPPIKHFCQLVQHHLKPSLAFAN